MGLFSKIGVNLSDAKHFGPAFLLRHFARFRKNRLIHLGVPGIGRVLVRQGESDVAVIRSVMRGGDYDLSPNPEVLARVVAHYRKLCDSGKRPVIVDAGANIGIASRWFRSQWPDAVIVAIEPDPRDLALLRHNLASDPHHVVLEAAVGSVAGWVELTFQPQSWGTRTTRAQSGVRVVTIDEALAAAGDEGVPFLCKIDIEGFESDLFADNLDWLDRFAVVAIEPHDWMFPGQGTSLSFQKAMAARDFEMVICGQNLFFLRL